MEGTNLPHSVAYIALKTKAQCNYRIANAEKLILFEQIINILYRSEHIKNNIVTMYISVQKQEEKYQCAANGRQRSR